jgi:hypothetical protein
MTETVSKPQELALAAEDAGWEVERKIEGTIKTVIATRSEERLEASWDGAKKCKPMGTHTILGHTVYVRRVTIAHEILKMDADDAIRNAEMRRKSGKQGTRATKDTVRMMVPFDPASDDDEVILEHVVGRRLTWTNRLSGESDDGVVPVNGKITKIELCSDPEDLANRELTFCGADGGGWRTIRLSDIINVGKKVDHGNMLTAAKFRAQQSSSKKGKK